MLTIVRICNSQKKLYANEGILPIIVIKRVSMPDLWKKKKNHNLLNIEDSAILRQESFSLVDWDSERDKLMDRCHSTGAHHHLYKPDRIPCGHLPLVLLFPHPPVKGKRSNHRSEWRERSNQRSEMREGEVKPGRKNSFFLSNKRTFFDIPKINNVHKAYKRLFL